MSVSLQDLINQSENFVDRLRNNPTGPYAFPIVPSEFANWRDESYAWAHTVALLDLTYHMTYLTMRGSDVVKFVERMGGNSFRHFKVNRAKQLICCAPSGHLIGDGILFFLAEEEVMYVGRAIVADWLEYNALTLGFKIELSRDARSPAHPMGKRVTRQLYRYQIQGPFAGELIAKLNGGVAPEIKFFHMGYITIAGRPVRALRHGMAGNAGLEIWGPYEEWEEVRSTILEAGREFGILPVGSRTYPAATFESGWLPSTLPAIYTGEELRPYREWLNGESYLHAFSIGGSFVSSRFEDYYLTPFESGYGPFIKFDHDFIGREALEKVDPATQRKKVTFEWEAEDVAKIMASILGPVEQQCKYIDYPMAVYSSHDYDLVSMGGKAAGFAMWSGYSYNIRAMLSVGVASPSVNIGDEVSILWGEPNGGSGKLTVERHRQVEVRARVQPCPYSEYARADYRSNPSFARTAQPAA